MPHDDYDSTPPISAKDLFRPPSRVESRLLRAGAGILSEPVSRLDYLHTVQCQCSLPYRNPGDGVRVWDRKQGHATLRIEAGSALDPLTGQFVELGLPYGEKPRLVLIHLASEAVRTGSPMVDVEGSMTAFARSIGLTTNGQQLTELKSQLNRLAASSVRMGMVHDGHAVQMNTQFVSAFELWFPREPDQHVLWPSTVRLSAEFFESLGRHAVPLDNRAVRALAHSSMSLDVYTWLAQRLHRVPPNKPAFLAWTVLYDQFGVGYTRLRDFRRAFLRKLRQVKTVYPTADLDADERGMTLRHSLPPVPSNAVLVRSPM